jgi:DNA replication protein DnaC
VNPTELDHALRKLRLSGMADTLETRLLQAQTENQAPIDTVSALVGDELVRRQDRLLARRIKAARFRDAQRTLDSFDFAFNAKIPKKLVFELATARFVSQCEDVLLLGPPGTGKSHLVRAIGGCRHRARPSCALPRGSRSNRRADGCRARRTTQEVHG